MCRLTRPRALRPGDTIAIVAPSSGVAARTPHRLEQARTVLEHHGYRVRIFDSVTRSPKENVERLISERRATGGSAILDPKIYAATNPCYGSADAITRAADLMEAFTDPGIGAIVCAIGGLNCHELFEYLDFERIRAHPKIFVGFSDITSLHLALRTKASLVTFYGPSAICQFGEFPGPLEYTLGYFWKAVAPTAIEPIGRVEPSREWTDDKTANWFTRADIDYVDQMKPNRGYEWLRPGTATGPILGGCLPVLLNVRGTEYMPDFTDAILLLETPEGHQFDTGMPMHDVNSVLGVLRLDGTFGRIRGLVVGRPFALSAADVTELKRLLLYHTRGTTFPILYGVDIGHTNPIITIPLGCRVMLDSVTSTFSIDEAGVQYE